MIAAVYCRVSTEEQAREGLSLDIQERRCREAAERDGAERIEVFRDEGHSGRTLERPAVRELLSRLDEFDVIYCIDQGRLTRNPADMERLYEQLEAQGVALLPLASPLALDQPDGVMVSRIQAAVDKRRIDEDRLKTIAALEEKAATGHHHGRCPLGYRRPRDEGGATIKDAPLQVMPREARIVRRIFDEYAAGATIKDIVQGLNADGVPGRRKSDLVWSTTVVARVLDNITYLGCVRFKGETYAGGHEAIIPERTWLRVRLRRQLDRQVFPRARRSLSGLFRCGLCGGVVHRVCGGVGDYWSYRCAARFNLPPEERHEPVSKSTVAVEAVLWRWTRELLGTDLWSRAAREEAARQAEHSEDLEDELAEVEREIAYNLRAARGGGLPHDMLREQQEPLIARRDELRRRLQAGPVDLLLPDEIRELLGDADHPVDLIEALDDPGLQRQFLARLYSVVELFPGGLVFHHRLSALRPRGVAFPRWRGGPRGWAEVDLTPWEPT